MSTLRAFGRLKSGVALERAGLDVVLGQASPSLAGLTKIARRDSRRDRAQFE